jgi:hypothetical protein
VISFRHQRLEAPPIESQGQGPDNKNRSLADCVSAINFDEENQTQTKPHGISVHASNKHTSFALLLQTIPASSERATQKLHSTQA